MDFFNSKGGALPKPNAILSRVTELMDGVRPDDRKATNNFQKWAWHPHVLGFLNVARRALRWRENSVDRTLMGIILVDLHGKWGAALSNQMRQSKAMAPDYAVRWWKERGLKPPKLDLVDFFERKVAWRYAKGVPLNSGKAITRLGDARAMLPRLKKFRANLILTSPPYCGVTNYEYDNWIRLWMLGGSELPRQSHARRYCHRENYRRLLCEVFKASKRSSRRDVAVYVRTDSRPVTLAATVDVLLEVWPDRDIAFRIEKPPIFSQTALFLEEWNNAGDVDLLLTSPGSKPPAGFRRFKKLSDLS